MEIVESRKIQNLRIITPDIFHDFRGEYVCTFLKTAYKFRDEEGAPIEFLEDDISVSRQTVLRGLHGDAKTWKLIQCLVGDIYLVVADMRTSSKTYLNWESFAIGEQTRKQILVPAGCANGHLCLSKRCMFSYKQSQVYQGKGDQFTIRWDDPKLGIWWPVKDPLLSIRDAGAAFL